MSVPSTKTSMSILVASTMAVFGSSSNSDQPAGSWHL